ncbi:MAG: MFS transporter [Thermodesulfovibrionales bacterium]
MEKTALNLKSIFALPKPVFILGIVSLFMDMSSEMIVPLMPIFLNDLLQASKLSIGLIEGVAESTASILKVISGWFSDKIGRRKPLIFWGYSLSVLSRPLLAGATSWIGVLIYRFTDRLGKGIRTSPRDALIADVTEGIHMGRAFGFHRAMDTLGAVIGPAIAFSVLALSSNNMRLVFWLSMIPGGFAIATIALFVKDVIIKKSEVRSQKKDFSLKNIDGGFKRFLFIAVLFTLGKIPEAFLLLRAKELGVNLKVIPIVYLLFNITTAVLATPSGIIADKIGKRKIIFLSYIVAGITFLGFALSNNSLYAWLLFIIYGLFVAMNEGNQRAFVASLINPEKKGTGYGIYHTMVGLSALPGGLISGYLYQLKGSLIVFLYGAFISIISAFIFYILLMRDIPDSNKGGS